MTKDLIKNLKIDNGTTTVYIPTPKGWKCKKKGCTTKVKHIHSTYPSIKNNAR